MASEKFYGPGEPYWGWRCFLCGEVLDSLICENRTHFPKRKQRDNRGMKEGKIGVDCHDHPGRRRNLIMPADGEYF